MEEFHKNFPSFEREYQKEMQNQQQNKLIIMQNNFNLMYPNISFSNLKKQNSNYLTNDGCTHFINPSTKEIYSWNFINNTWTQHNNNYQQNLLKLFN